MGGFRNHAGANRVHPAQPAFRELRAEGADEWAGVWAEENTRSAIYDALRRKETFSTSGTRIRLRFFAGYDLPAPDAQDLIAAAYQGGVPMGADLVPGQWGQDEPAGLQHHPGCWCPGTHRPVAGSGP